MKTAYGYPGALLAAWLLISPLLADPYHPLAVADTSSPRATLESFQGITEEARRMAEPDVSLIEDQTARRSFEEMRNKAMHCLDLSRLPRERIDDDGETAVIYLQEILDRIEIPSYQDIPDANSARVEELSRWTIPNTELTIAKVKEGPREGDWLFSPETIAHLKNYYHKIKDLSYRPDAILGSLGPLGGSYSYYLFLPEPSLPAAWIDDLPAWTRTIYLEQPVWKWVGIVGRGG